MRILFAWCALSMITLAQSLPVPTPEEQTTYRYYIRFFQSIKNVDAAQARSAAQGKDTTGWTKLLIEESGISPEEDSSIKAIARDALTKLSANQVRRGEFLSNMRKQFPEPQKAPSSMQSELADFWRRDFQIVNQHVSQIKMALGDARFAMFDTYVRTKYKLQPATSNQ